MTDLSVKRLLPAGWQRLKVSKIGPVIDGDWIVNTDYAPSGVRLLQVGDVGVGRFIGKSSRFISQKRAQELNCNFLQPDDILISRMPDPIGRACQLPDLGYSCITAVDVSIWRPSGKIADRQYLTHYLNSPEWFFQAQALASGATRARISRKNLENLEIPLPPLTEQKRIAAVLTGHMAEVEKARTATAIQLDAAKALSTAYLREIFNSNEAQKWTKKKFSTVCDVIGGMQPPKHTFKYAPQSGYVRLVQIQDFRRGDMAVYIPEQEAKRSFETDDVMIGRYGPPVFQILRGLSGAYNVALMKTVPSHHLLKDYLFYVLQEPSIQRAVIGESQRSAGQTGIQRELLESLSVPVPDLSTQARIANLLDAKIAGSGELQRLLREQLSELQTLPFSLLEQAFSGKI